MTVPSCVMKDTGSFFRPAPSTADDGPPHDRPFIQALGSSGMTALCFMHLAREWPLARESAPHPSPAAEVGVRGGLSRLACELGADLRHPDSLVRTPTRLVHVCSVHKMRLHPTRQFPQDTLALNLETRAQASATQLSMNGPEKLKKCYSLTRYSLTLATSA